MASSNSSAQVGRDLLPAYQNLLNLYESTEDTPSEKIDEYVDRLPANMNKTLQDGMFGSFSVTCHFQGNIEYLKQGVQWIAMEIFNRLSEGERDRVRSSLTHSFQPILSGSRSDLFVSSDDDAEKAVPSDFTVKLLKSLNECAIHRRKDRQEQMSDWIEAAHTEGQRQSRAAAKDEFDRFLNDDRITALCVKGEELGCLPDVFNREPFVSRLEVAAFSETGLAELPLSLFQLKSLKRLIVRDNLLTRLPVDVMRLESLVHLDVTGNQLSKIPSELDRLSNLESLVLDDNRLKKIPWEIGNLKQLVYLGLKGNQELQTLPIQVVELAKTCKINAEETPVESMIKTVQEVFGNDL